MLAKAGLKPVVLEKDKMPLVCYSSRYDNGPILSNDQINISIRESIRLNSGSEANLELSNSDYRSALMTEFSRTNALPAFRRDTDKAS